MMIKISLLATLITAAPFTAHVQLPNRQSATASSNLSSCLTADGVPIASPSDAIWENKTTAWQGRIKPKPALLAYPIDEAKLASSLSCALRFNTPVTPLSGGHSFAAYGYGNDGDLVVSMEAFTSMSFNATTTLLTYGGGSRIGPVAKFLWDGYGRHFPHARHGRPGLAGSSIGGGFGTTSRYLGTQMDSLDSVTFMLYNGTSVTASRDSDLLFAAQGAGASFGIITSLTTKTYLPIHETAINFTLFVGSVSLEVGTAALMALQEYALNNASDEFAIRWSLSAPPFRGTGYYYGDPANFESDLQPLMDRMPAGTTLTKSEFDWWTQESLANPGLNDTDGGSSPSRTFYVQALTMTADKPFTSELASTLFNYTTLAFNRTDITKSGYLDLWGGVSRDVKDSDTSFAHGNNLWLIRWEANKASKTPEWPADGVQYLKAGLKPFEDALKAADIPLRGFANYRDTSLSQAEWSERLYGVKNFARLQRIKVEVDPLGMFTNNAQSIPLP
jgi:hypothetical protein